MAGGRVWQAVVAGCDDRHAVAEGGAERQVADLAEHEVWAGPAFHVLGRAVECVGCRVAARPEAVADKDPEGVMGSRVLGPVVHGECREHDGVSRDSAAERHRHGGARWHCPDR